MNVDDGVFTEEVWKTNKWSKLCKDLQADAERALELMAGVDRNKPKDTESQQDKSHAAGL